MASIEVTHLREDLPFGAIVTGVNREAIADEAICDQLRAIFEDRGLIAFKGVERSTQFQVELSNVFGGMLHHPFAAIKKVDEDTMPGVIDINVNPDDASIVELEGKQLSSWVPWHFDNAYTKELCRAAILRAIEIPPEGGMTGFADGIQMYEAISSELRERFSDLKIIYDPHLLLENLRFGLPADWRFLRIDEGGRALLESTANSPRAVHPAIWQRETGEHVLHVGWQNAAGIYGHENPAGDALLEELCSEMTAKMTPYWHQWEPMDMVVFDNWRFVHAISGNDPKYARRMHRTTIAGDYGLGQFEDEANSSVSLDTVQ